ncbi:hypothetical protein MPNT_210054 [Candidatus Methylacidithermus pantelleriae]|uniref:Uncharacterized protein n=1 Tax=Candidatus Methylacidithermus pantelleriae TaxID=2744239 RepID=A0A8J2BJI5_9BACT|nr:hypothetical protein MPNT_210054 [Candidatus Methylacidithermus pantelleriae]
MSSALGAVGRKTTTLGKGLVALVAQLLRRQPFACACGGELLFPQHPRLARRRTPQLGYLFVSTTRFRYHVLSQKTHSVSFSQLEARTRFGYPASRSGTLMRPSIV